MFLDQTQFEKSWQDRFSKTAEEEKEDYRISYWAKQGLEIYQKYFLEYFNPYINNDNSQALVLDLGCGPGTFSKLLAERGFKVYGVDYSKKMIETAKRKSEGYAINYQVAGIYDLPFGADFFDIVICLGVFQHIERENEAIGEIKRVLKKDGLAVITTLNKFSFRSLFQERKADISARRYNPYNLKKTLSKEEFSEIKLAGVYFAPFSFLTNLIFKLKIYKLFNIFFPFFIFIAHSFYLEGNKKIYSIMKRPPSLFKIIINTLTFPIRALFMANEGRFGLSSLREERMQVVAKYCKGKVLDIGCGSGNLFIKEFIGKDQGTGIDVFPYQGVSRVVEDMTNLPFKDSSFDTVTLIGTSSYIPKSKRKAEFAEFTRILKPGGLLLMTEGEPITQFLNHKWRKFFLGLLRKTGGKGFEEWPGEGEPCLPRKEIMSYLNTKPLKFTKSKRFMWGLNNVYIARREI